MLLFLLIKINLFLFYTKYMFLLDICLYLFCFLVLWVGAGFIISSVDRLSKRLKISSFALSFFVLGLLTSIPELAVGLTAMADYKPDIFFGNLIGGSIVIFLLILPVLAIFGNGIKLNSQLSDKNLIFSFLVIVSPLIALIDQKISFIEGISFVVLYGVLFYFIESSKGVFDNNHTNVLHTRSYSYFDILKILFGVVLVFISSNLIVGKTIFFAESLNIPVFYISLIIVSLGTNLPEISIVLRSVIYRKKDIAFGDYLGSASANTLLFGLFTLLYSQPLEAKQNFLPVLLLFSFSLGLFYFFSRSKRDISRKEGFFLLGIYILFQIFELSRLIT